MLHTRNRHAFTLIELAIVLVIIGLLVGGVLIAQTLINSSALRATVSQFERFNAGGNTFRTKYSGLPGDLRASRAASYDLTPRAGTTGQGDGNGAIQNGSVVGAGQGIGHETALFWRDLNAAGLIGGTFETATDAPAASLSIGDLSLYLPATKVRQSTYFHVYSVGSRNFYYIGGFGANPTDADGAVTLATTISPADAFSIDEKVDNAVGNSGVVIAVDDLATNSILTGSGTSTDCLNTDGTYNVDRADRDLTICRISARASF